MGRAVATASVTGACMLSLGGSLGAATAPAFSRAAHAARLIFLHERAQLHKTSRHLLTLNEQGSASGTIRGTIYIHLHVESNRVSAEVNIYPSGGSLTGYASASYHVAGGFASFSGTMSIARGTGHYAHAHASGLRFAGSIERINDATSVEVSGKLYE